MASSGRATRLLKAMNLLAKKTTFDYDTVFSKVKLQSVSNGTFQGKFIVDKTMCNMGGSLHGGYIAAVTDVLSFYTLVSNTDGRLCWTTSMNVHYVGIAGDGEQVNVETKTLKSGNSSVIETYFTIKQGKLLAKGTTSFLIANEKFQGIIKEILDFDVYEN